MASFLWASCGARCAENPVAHLAVGAYASARDNDVEGVRAALEVMEVDTPDAVRGPVARRTLAQRRGQRRGAAHHRAAGGLHPGRKRMRPHQRSCCIQAESHRVCCGRQRLCVGRKHDGQRA
jgi:hypothetical protein